VWSWFLSPLPQPGRSPSPEVVDVCGGVATGVVVGCGADTAVGAGVCGVGVGGVGVGAGGVGAGVGLGGVGFGRGGFGGRGDDVPVVGRETGVEITTACACGTWRTRTTTRGRAGRRGTTGWTRGMRTPVGAGS
jgi:hypothetical protein